MLRVGNLRQRWGQHRNMIRNRRLAQAKRSTICNSLQLLDAVPTEPETRMCESELGPDS